MGSDLNSVIAELNNYKSKLQFEDAEDKKSKKMKPTVTKNGKLKMVARNKLFKVTYLKKTIEELEGSKENPELTAILDHLDDAFSG